jgi:hypothetical protein
MAKMLNFFRIILFSEHFWVYKYLKYAISIFVGRLIRLGWIELVRKKPPILPIHLINYSLNQPNQLFTNLTNQYE